MKLKLHQAGMNLTPERFVKKTALTSFYMCTGIFLFLFIIFDKLGASTRMLIIIYPFALLVLFWYFLKLPDMRILQKEKGISREIVFAGRFLIIELESGVPLYKTFLNVARNYEVIGQYFKEIIDKVNIGTSFEDALNDSAENAPCADLRKVFWQILNSMRTGSDVTKSLGSVFDQITREQQIMVQEYGRKLNPLAMFYMMLAVILPSLGMILFMILATFIGIQLSLGPLISIACFLGFLQFMFVSIIRSSRPPVDL